MPQRLKIAFIASHCVPFHGRTLEERPLGGTETGVIRLAQALARLGHQVVVVAPFPNPPLTAPLFVPPNAIADIGPVDVFIAVRDWQALFAPLPARLRCFWTGDSYDQPVTFGLGDSRVAKQIDLLLAVSEWHKATLCKTTGFPTNRCWVLGNGVHLPYFQGTEQRERKRLIYSSTPYRGLEHLLEIFPEIRKRHPGAELAVFSSMKVYAAGDKDAEIQDRSWQDLNKKLGEVPGVTLHGSVAQARLAREFMRSAILCYPNTFEETCCITALEARAAGCAIVTSQRGALPETVADAGLLIPGTPGHSDYNASFVEAVCKILEDDSLFARFSAAGIAKRELFSWEAVARRFAELVQSVAATREHSLASLALPHSPGAAAMADF